MAVGVERLYETVSEKDLEELTGHCGWIKGKSEMSDPRFKEECLKNFEKAEGGGMKILCPEDEDYPENLKNIYLPPLCLYYYGRLPDEKRKTVAVVGCRNCTDYGLRMADYFGEGLSRHGIQIVSGMALGIDGRVQRQVLDRGGETFGVLGSGADVIYPKNNADLYERLKKQGGIISEIPPGGEPVAVNFPRRNRLIAGLSNAVLVIEAPYRSGSLITVNYGVEQGKEIMAVPGRIDDPMSAGCLDVIKSGAAAVTSIDDAIDVISKIFI